MTLALLAGCSDSERVMSSVTSSDGSVLTSAAPPPASIEISPVVRSTDLGCSGNHSDVPANYTVYFDAVALPTTENYPMALQTGSQLVPSQPDADRPGRLFAKAGLYFKPGHSFEVVVPEALRDRMSIGWSIRSWRVTVSDCRGVPSDWMAFVGGYWVADPFCAELILRSGGEERHVNIGLGAPCPGQAPPPTPSDV